MPTLLFIWKELLSPSGPCPENRTLKDSGTSLYCFVMLCNQGSSRLRGSLLITLVKPSAYQQQSAPHITMLPPLPCLPRTLRGALPFRGISHLEGGFTLRCLQRLSLPGLATLPWGWSPTGTPVARPSRSSRTKDSSSQISCACAG